MKVIVERDVAGVSRRAADVVQDYLNSTLQPALGLATGGSVEPLYQELVRRHRQGNLSFAEARAFLLDEYVGLGNAHPQRYSNVIAAQLMQKVDLNRQQLHFPDGDAADLGGECDRYEELIRRAEIGLQILGIGGNGHLAFNEPGSSQDSLTRVVRLSCATRADNARFFSDPRQVPRYAITQGLATIRRSGHLLVLAVGAGKAPAVRAALEGPITPEVPATVLRLHPQVTLALDQAAASQTGHAGSFDSNG